MAWPHICQKVCQISTGITDYKLLKFSAWSIKSLIISTFFFIVIWCYRGKFWQELRLCNSCISKFLFYFQLFLPWNANHCCLLLFAEAKLIMYYILSILWNTLLHKKVYGSILESLCKTLLYINWVWETLCRNAIWASINFSSCQSFWQ